MFRLSSRIRASQWCAWAGWLAVGGLAASVGCSPAENDHQKQAAQDRQAAQSAPSNGKLADGEPADDKLADEASARDQAAGSSKPSGNIPVNEEGYVTFGQSVERSSESSSEQPDRKLEETRKRNASGKAVEGAAEQTAEQVPARRPSSASLRPAEELMLSSEPTPAEPEKSPRRANTPTPASSPADETAQSPSSVKAQTVSTEAQHSPESGLATYDERHQKIAEGWPKPQAVLFLTGQQHGYIEPCGCTGLENQKGGLNRRDTLLKQLEGRGWDVVPMDVGNFERRVGRQAEIKFQTTVEALKDMHYRAATLGVDDLKLSSTHLLSLTATEGKTETPFISANAYILVEEYMPKSKIIQAGGRKIGVTAVLGDSFREDLKASDDVMTSPAAESLKPVVKELKKAGCDYLVLLAHTTLQESQQLAKEVPGFDLVVTAGGFPEPPYELEPVEGSDAKIAQVGAKGMYTVLIGLYPDSDQPVRYQRVALSSQFADSPRMLERFANYQKQLENLGFEGLGLRAATHPSGREFVGSEKCGECHTKAFEVWKGSKHFAATESLVKPPNDRSMIPRHHDPECLSCHVTGWNPQNYYPYATGYVSLEKTPMLTGSGCENCHGPGSAHVAAESGDVEADDTLLSQLREQMRLPLAEAQAKCTECHDQDNSPDFQHEGAFEKYWAQIAHPGKD
ncbi:MAG: multiheme c-type cytochrome [Aureliella sp.]